MWTRGLLCVLWLPSILFGTDSLSLPLTFERNAGQAPPEVRFLARRPGMDVLLGQGGATFVLKGKEVALKFVGTNLSPAIAGENKSSGASNYLIGTDTARWITGVEQYQRVRYREIYPGVDAVFYGTGSQLEYDLELRPGANLSRVVLQVKGAKRIREHDGNIVVDLGGGQVRCKRPQVYQEIEGKRRQIEAGYVVRGQKVRFKVGRYDHAKPLVIDPVLDYSTYLGGSGPEWGYAIATDSSGNAYITGMTQSSNFPIRSAMQSTASGGLGDVFVTKVRPDNTGIIYSTYIGGDGTEGDTQGYVGGIAVDAAGSAYVTGVTRSPHFPTTPSSFQPVFGTHDTCGTGPTAGYCGDAFVLKLNAAGNALVYSSFLGGSNHDEGKALAIDESDAAYVVGVTTSYDFPTTPGAFQSSLQYEDIFVSKVSADGSALVYSTLLGGSGYDLGLAVAVDSSGRAHVTGMTQSDDFPTKNALQTKLGEPWDVFVTNLNAAGTDMEFSTLLGGTGTQQAVGIALDPSGDIYLAGYTDSADFPIVNAFQPDYGGGGGNGFVTKVSADGGRILYSTFMGGYDAVSELDAITVDSTGAAYVAGSGGSDFPVVNTVRPYSGTADIVFAKLTPDGSGVYFSSFFGGNGYDLASGITMDPQNRILLTGQTASTNFPTYWGPQGSLAGPTDAFLLRFSLPADDKPILSAPRTVQLGNTYVGQLSPPKTIRINNTGTRTLNISKVTTAASVTATTNCGSVTPGGSCSVTASLKLNAPGPGTGTFVLYNDAADSPQTFTLRGTGVYGGDVELVSLTTGTLTGSYGSLVQPFTAVVRNNGPFDAEGVTLRISNNIGGSECNPCMVGTLRAGNSTTLSFNRTPTVFGNLTITGTVSTATRTPDINAANDVRSVTFGVPLYSKDVAQIDFGSQAVNARSVPHRIKFHGIGGGPFRVSLSVTGDYSLTTSCGDVDDSGCFADVVFAPSAAGTRAGTLWIDELNAGTSQAMPLTGVGMLAPSASLSPVSVDLGTRMIGRASQPASVLLSNNGSAPLQISAIGSSGEFSVTHNCPASLNASASCAITVTFTPMGKGVRTGSITVYDNATDSPQDVILTGYGETASATVAPALLDLGMQRVGTSSDPRSVTLTNISGIALRIDSISTPAGFQQTNNCTVVAPDQSCHLNVVFSPGAIGTYGETLIIRDDGVGSPRAIGLGGTGIQSVLSLDRNSIDFGAIRVDLNSPTQFVALTNAGNASMSIASVTTTGDFSASSGCGSALAAESTCYVVASFHPTVAGLRTGEIVITDNAPGSPHRVTLSGTGKPRQVNISPAALTFAAQKIGLPSTAQTITVSNDTGAAMSITSITATGDFTQTNNCGAFLATDLTCTVQVTFTPTSTGVRSGMLSIIDATGTHTVSLSGSGAASSIGIDRMTIDYGSLLINASRSETIVITSNGAADLNISALQIHGIGFDYNSTCPARLAIGKTCTVTARFTPTATGSSSGTLTIRDDAPGSPHVVALTGWGTLMTVTIGRPDRSGRDTTPVQMPSAATVQPVDVVPLIPAPAPVVVSPGESGEERGGLTGEDVHRSSRKKVVSCKEKKNPARNARQAESIDCANP